MTGGRPLAPHAERNAVRSAALASLVLLGICTLLIAQMQATNIGQASAAAPILASGTVLRPDGDPIPNAQVWLVVPVGEPSGRRRIASAITNDMGFYELRADLPKPEPEARLQVIIAAPGWGLTAAWVPYGGYADTQVSLPVRARLSLIGPDGKPAANVRIRPARLRGPGIAVLLPSLIDADDPLWYTTDAQGQCTIEDVPEMAQLMLAVADERFAQFTGFERGGTREADWIVVEPGSDPSLRLRRGGSIRGRVTFAPTSRPAEHIGLEVRPHGIANPTDVVWTDKNGEYRVGQLAADRYHLALRLTDELSRSWTAVDLDDVQLADGQTLGGQDLKLIEGATIAGKVLAAGTSQGLPGVSLRAQRFASGVFTGRVRDITTGPDGSYSFRVPPGSDYVITWRTPPPQGSLPPERRSIQVRAEDGKIAKADFELPRNPIRPVLGVLLDPDGKPAEGATVTASGGTPDERSLVRTDVQGRFSIYPLGSSAKLEASLGELRTGAPILVRGGETLTLALHREPILVGSVTDAEGRPIAGAYVEPRIAGNVDPLMQFAETRCVQEIDGGIVPMPGPASWLTDIAGLYAIRIRPPPALLDAGKLRTLRYSVVAFAREYGSNTSAEVAPPKEGENVVPAIVLPRAESYVAGRVVDGEGKPVAGVRVSASFVGNQSLRRSAGAQTDSQGRFRINELVADEAVWLVVSDGTRSARIAGGAPAVDLRLELQASGGVGK